MDINATLVKELREKTGVGMMECKKALSHSNGDLEKAVQYLREKGIATAAKKSDRSTKEGRIAIYISPDGKEGAIIEINCETDFVAKNDDFVAFGDRLCEAVLKSSVSMADQIASVSVMGKPFNEYVSSLILKVGENISVKRLAVVRSQGRLAGYIHSNSKIGVLVDFNHNVDEALGKDIAMHVAASHPLFVRREDAPASEVEKEREIVRNQALNEGRPAQVIDKIVEGRVGKYFKEVCLLEQPFVKDPDKSVRQVLPSSVGVSQFIRYSLV